MKNQPRDLFGDDCKRLRPIEKKLTEEEAVAYYDKMIREAYERYGSK